MKLYSYWRSSAAYRVRIALNLKGAAYEIVPVSLIKDGGEQHAPWFTALNANAAVPVLALDDGTILTQSLAIIDYLNDVMPEPAFLPREPLERAKVQAAALLIACDIHPLNNTRVLQRLRAQFGAPEPEVVTWMRHWMGSGLAAYSRSIAPDAPFSFGPKPGLADICLVPQLANARRWGLDLAGLERLTDIERRCLERDAFARAAPQAQPDAPPDRAG
jgi:maleylacetoacetate isomerase/maleylpyruvate isomerase